MSVEAMRMAFRSDLGPGPRLVLLTLADRAGDHEGEDPTCFPSTRDLVRRTGFNEKSVRRHLDYLFAEGWISRKRRRLANGRLGIYDFTLHGDPAVRAELKAQRKASGVTLEAEEIAASEGAPADNLSAGEASAPADNLTAASGQFDRSPADKLSGQETPRETSLEPPQGAGARADAPDLCSAAWNACAPAMKVCSSPVEHRRAWDAEVRLGSDPAAMLEATQAYAADPKAWGRSGAPLSAHNFMITGRWTGFVGRSTGGSEEPAQVFAGPAELRSALAEATSEGFVGSYVMTSRWDPGGRVLHPRTGVAAERLRASAEAMRVLRAFGVTLGEVSRGAA